MFTTIATFEKLVMKMRRNRGTGTVTILDVDPDEEKPYKIGFDTFYKGLCSYCRRILRSSGFGGGYVFVKLHD